MNIISKTTVLPTRGVIRSSSLLFVFLLAFFGTAHTVASQTRSDPQSITDMVVVTDEISNKPVVYVVDEQSAAIYSLTSSMVTSSLGKRDLKEFQVFFSSPELVRPSGLAYYNGKLVICVRTGSIFELDTTKRNLSLLFKGGELRNPSRIAVSQSGRVAVSNNSGKIVLYDRSNKVAEIQHKFDNPIRLAFSGETLLVLEGQGTILWAPQSLRELGLQAL